MYHLKTVLFDLDGTLLDTLSDLADSVNAALAMNAHPVRTLDEVRQFVGNGITALMNRAVPEGTPPEAEKKCLEDFRTHYLTNMEHKTAPYPGVMELLQALEERGIRTAVVSNKFDGAVKGLCDRYFSGHLSAAVGEQPGLAKKPAPDLVCKALTELGGNTVGALYVGDSDVDIETARNAGLPCISVTWGFRDRDFLLSHGAERLIDRPEELLTISELRC